MDLDGAISHRRQRGQLPFDFARWNIGPRSHRKQIFADLARLQKFAMFKTFLMRQADGAGAEKMSVGELFDENREGLRLAGSGQGRMRVGIEQGCHAGALWSSSWRWTARTIVFGRCFVSEKIVAT